MEIIADSEAKNYSEEYKSYVFRFWFVNGKRGHVSTYEDIPEKVDFITHKELNQSTLANWIKSDFLAHADYLDEQVIENFDEKLVKDRVEMLQKHAEIAEEMQSLALEHIREEGMESSRTAITALIQGIKIERESRGLPLDELLQLKDKSDSELVGVLREIIKDGKVLELEPVNAESQEA